MNMSAPHLPPKSCQLETRRRVMSLPWLISIVLLAMVAGGSAAMMAAAWVIPTFLTDTSVYIRNRGSQEESSFQQMEALLARQIEQRLVSVYDKRKAVGDTLYSNAAKTGMLAFLSSDGWGVMHDPSYVAGAEQFWHVVDSQGSVIPIEKVVHDKTSQLVFVKLQGNGFQVFSFMDWRDVEAGLPVWMGGVTEWKKTVFDIPAFVAKDTAVAPHISSYVYTVKDMPRHADVILSEQGQLVGFVGQNGSVVPGFITMSHLPYILTEGVLRQKTLPVLGHHVSHQITENGITPVSGFYITSISSPVVKKILQPGDVIVKINGQIVTAETIAQLLFTSSDDMLVDVWRKGIITREIMVKKEIGV